MSIYWGINLRKYEKSAQLKHLDHLFAELCIAKMLLLERSENNRMFMLEL